MSISTACRWRRDAPSSNMEMFADYSNVHLLAACLSIPAHRVVHQMDLPGSSRTNTIRHLPGFIFHFLAT